MLQQAIDQLQGVAQDILSLAAQQGAKQAEVSIELSHGFSVSARHGAVETVEHNQDKVLMITVYMNQCAGNVSIADTRAESIHAAVRAACDIARYTASDPFSGLADRKELAFNYPHLKLAYPWSVTLEQAIQLACACEQHALRVDRRIMDAESVSVSTAEMGYIYANSHDFMGHFIKTQHEISCILVAKKKEEMQRDHYYTVCADSSQLEEISCVAQKAAEKTLKRLGGRRLPTTTMRVPVIFIAEEARGLIGHFVRAISGEALYKKTTFLVDCLHTQVFPSFVQIDEQPHLSGGLSSVPFDGEGVATQSNQFVKDGVLSQYILNSYSARKLGMRTTGNAGGVHNLQIQSGPHSLTALIKMMDRGILITELIGEGVNILTGDYSRGAIGYWVEQGEVQYPVREITIASTLQLMYKQMVAIANDIDLRGNIRTGSILLAEMMVAGMAE